MSHINFCAGNMPVAIMQDLKVIVSLMVSVDICQW